MFLSYSILGDLATLAAARSTDGSPEVLPKSWENFERVHNTQKRMPKLVYNQLKKGKICQKLSESFLKRASKIRSVLHIF